MSIDSIVENACVQAIVTFQNKVDAEFIRSTTGLDAQDAAIARCRAIEKALPDMMQTALTIALTELVKNIEEKH
ncbi:hypothetical protein [Acetanaerobacterium elongatum]|uniref:Uncharacterized protein n=1 Tax=Acetanaerobacterium elongatum TaxID=258515 RepID=A0A1G9U4J9_9FIRM|nr:hypothetical protein [Acetanaerobacterium elongatum]SDM54505.1 hypothetical protein SAMN05192585_10164 [Acetanaerobacterium elongatum]